MGKGRRIGAVLAAAAMAIGVAMTVSVSPAAAAPKKFKGPQPVSQLLKRVDDNETSEVRVWFKTDKKACNFRLRVWDSNGIEIHHPQGSYTSLNWDSTLGKNEVDYAAFDVEVDDFNRDSVRLLFGQITWKWCGGNNNWQSKSTGFLLPIDA